MAIPANQGKINFPLYSVSPLSCNHVIVTGGGGAANTGVFNGFAICEIGYEKNDYVAYEVQRYNAGTSAIMNSAIGSLGNGKRFYLAAGKDADCYIYQVKLRPRDKQAATKTPDTDKENANLRQRNVANGKPASSNETEESTQQELNETFAGDLVFDIQTVVSAQTDFSLADPCQRAVAFSPDSRLVVTGGTDGILRVWNFPEMLQRSTINASKKEISDVDISPDRKLISCISGDGKCKIWSMVDGKLHCALDLPPEDEGKFKYKKGRFGVVEDKRNTTRLFVIVNPINYKQNKSYIQQWTGPSFAISQVSCVGEALSALAVSKCGRYLAIGSMTTGDVDIYIAYSLQRLKHIERAHKTFVTGLAFLPPAQPNEEAVLAECDAAVVSISVDNQINIHYIEKTQGVSMRVAVVLVVLVLLLTFMFCSWIDL